MSDSVKLFSEKHVAIADRVRGSVKSDVALAPWRERASNPGLLLSRWLSGLRFPDNSALAVSGVGDGSHVLALLERMPASGLVFCAEPDLERFKAFLATPTAVSLLKDDRVVFGVGALDDAFFNSLASMGVMEHENAEPLIFAPLFSADEDYYSSFFLEFARRLDVWRQLYGTNLTKSGLWQGNTFRNFRSLIRTPDPVEFYGAFKGLPMIMAGAGPSLGESLEFLRWAQDRAVIVAGNSSIRALVNGGVRPHFVLAADPNISTDSGFEGVELGDTVLLCPFMVYPAVVKRFEGRVSAWAHNNSVATYFRKVVGKENGAHVTEQGTISACAFDFAITFGCSSLFFVGQDLAARTDGRMHADDTFYTDLGADKANLDKCRWVPGNTIEKVPVEEKLFVYLKTFEQLSKIFSVELEIKGREKLRLYNLSRLGARIENMPYIDFETAKTVVEESGNGSNAVGWARVQSVLSVSQGGWGRVGKVLNEFRSYVEGICSFALKRALALELEELEIESVESDKAELDAMLAANSDFSAILNDGQLKMELFVFQKAKAMQLRRGALEDPAVRLEVLKGYFWAIAEGSYKVLSDLDASREAQLR